MGHVESPLWSDSDPSALWLHSEKLGAAFVRRNARPTQPEENNECRMTIVAPR